MYPNCAVFCLQLTRYIYNTLSQFNNCWGIVVYGVTVHNNFAKYRPPESRQAWTRQIMDCRTFSKLPGWLQIVWQAPKVRWRIVSSFLNWSWIPWVLKCAQRQKSKWLRSGEREGCTSKTVCGHRFAFPKYSQKRCRWKQLPGYEHCVFSSYHHYICGEDHEIIIITIIFIIFIFFILFFFFFFFFLNVTTAHCGPSHP
jgi:hypothetical protein